MAVLLECAACFQNYTVSKQALDRPTRCPWCGASSASNLPGTTEANFDASPLSAIGASAILDAQIKRHRVRFSERQLGLNGDENPPRFHSDLGAPAVIRSHSDAPNQAVVPAARSPDGKRRLSRSAAAIRLLVAARFGRRKRSMPALLWLAIGIGLGACAVLLALTIWFPQVFERNRKNEHDGRNAARPVDRAAQRGRATASDPLGGNVREDRQVEERRELGPANDDRQREQLRRWLREELKTVVADERREPPSNATTPRWKSDRPPPIGDPDDDSPGIGLTVPEDHSTPQKRQEVLAVADRVVDRVRQDDSAAIKELAAAGIDCQKDSAAGLVQRIDGSFRMTDALMAQVSKLPNVVRLKLSFSNVTDEGLAHVESLTGLKELMLNETKATDASVSLLEDLVELEKLDLEKTLVTDACLAHLKKLQKLRHIDLRGTKVTPGGVADLKAALPTARIRL